MLCNVGIESESGVRRSLVGVTQLKALKTSQTFLGLHFLVNRLQLIATGICRLCMYSTYIF